MFKDLKNIIYDKTFRITIFEDKVDIINYENILVFEDEKIIIKTNKGLVKIIGKDLVVSKLFNSEVLIKGNIKKVELGWLYDKLLLNRNKRKECKKSIKPHHKRKNKHNRNKIL